MAMNCTRGSSVGVTDKRNHVKMDVTTSGRLEAGSSSVMKHHDLNLHTETGEWGLLFLMSGDLDAPMTLHCHLFSYY